MLNDREMHLNYHNQWWTKYTNHKYSKVFKNKEQYSCNQRCRAGRIKTAEM